MVPLELVLTRTQEAAICISRLAAYPTGFEFEVLAIAAPGQEELDELDPMMFGPHRRLAMRRSKQEAIPPELLRIGVQFADGSKATNLGGLPGFQQDEEPPAAPVMHTGGGGGGGGHWRYSHWVWPLPPPGPLSFVCEWPAAGIPLTRKEIDAKLILDAAKRAQPIFPESGGTQSGSWTTYAPLQSIKPRPEPPSTVP